MNGLGRGGCVVALLLAGCIGPPGPQGDPGPQGPPGAGYARTVVVSPVGTRVQNGAALLAALDGITTASINNPFLLKLEPGIYELTGNGQGVLFMKDGVDIEGSGERNTAIVGTGTNTILGADADLRFVTVTNSGSGTFQTSVSTYATTRLFRMMHVTLNTYSSGGMFAYGFSGNATISDSNIFAGGASSASVGIFSNDNGEVTVTDSVLVGTEHGIQLQSGRGQVMSSQVVGGGVGVACVYCYDLNLAPLNDTCN